LYRVARLHVQEDEPITSASQEQELRQQLGQRVMPFFSTQQMAMEHLQRLLHGELPLGALCDIFSFALPLGLEVKQQLLEELHVERRVRLLLAQLPDKTPSSGEGPKRSFPPTFSAN
jgi:Lon protease-like protein